MALNKFMHKRNIYRNNRVDFKSLAEKYEDFRQHVITDDFGKVSIDFKDCAALRSLTITLLQEHFQLEVDLPLDRLIPTVPLRLNYIHWIEDIVGRESGVSGLDIGTGSCCIYPLLGHRINGWKFLATEVDNTNVTFAQENVRRNRFSDSIEVQKVCGETVLLEALSNNTQTFDFCMCNPPFFADHMEAQAITTSRSCDRPDAVSSNCAHPTESIVEGGEAMFVRKMIADSLQLKDRVRVFTSMVGKKASLSLIKSFLHQSQIKNYGVTEFCQGRTMRWGVGWTFADGITFPKSEFRDQKTDNKPPLVYDIPKDINKVAYDVPAVRGFISTLLTHNLQMPHDLTKSTPNYTSWKLKPVDKSWTNQRRKRRLQQRSGEGTRCGDVIDLCASKNTESSQGAGLDAKNPPTEDVTGLCASKNARTTDASANTTQSDVTNSHTNTKTDNIDMSANTETKTDMVNMTDLSADDGQVSNVTDSSLQTGSTREHKLVLDENGDGANIVSETGTETMSTALKESSIDDKDQNNPTDCSSCVTASGDATNSSQIDVTTTKTADESCTEKSQTNKQENLYQNTYESARIEPLAGSLTDTNVGSTIDKPDLPSSENTSDKMIPDEHSSKTVKTDSSKTVSPKTVSPKNVSPPKGQKDLQDKILVKNADKRASLFDCYLNVKKAGDLLRLEMVWIDGADRNHMYQLMQFFKNHLQ